MRIIYVTSEGVAPVLDRERLRRLGDYTEYSDADLKREGAVPLLKDAEILMCGTNWITPELIAACPRLKLVVMRATGFNTVDLSCTAGRDITIARLSGHLRYEGTNIPGDKGGVNGGHRQSFSPLSLFQLP